MTAAGGEAKSIEAFGLNLEVELILRLFDQDDNPGSRQLIDVGANVGHTSQPFVRMGWNALLVEPDPRNVQALKDLYAGNERVTIDERACTDRNGESVTLFTGADSALTTLRAFHDSHQAYCEVKTVTLATLLETYGINKLDVLKTDAEGFDLFVLKGMDWKRCPPSIILSEFDEKKTVPLGYTTEDMIGYLEEQGYKVIVAERFPLLDYDPSIPRRRRGLFAHGEHEIAPGAWGDVIAVRDPAEFARLEFAGKIYLDLQRRIWDLESRLAESEKLARGESGDIDPRRRPTWLT